MQKAMLISEAAGVLRRSSLQRRFQASPEGGEAEDGIDHSGGLRGGRSTSRPLHVREQQDGAEDVGVGAGRTGVCVRYAWDTGMIHDAILRINVCRHQRIHRHTRASRFDSCLIITAARCRAALRIQHLCLWRGQGNVFPVGLNGARMLLAARTSVRNEGNQDVVDALGAGRCSDRLSLSPSSKISEARLAHPSLPPNASALFIS